MADSLTTTTQVDPAVSIFYDRVLLETALPLLVHEKLAKQRPIPSKNGNTIKFRRYSSLSAATTPLTEGVTPSGSLLSKTDLTAQVSWYGDFVHVTDVVDMTVEDPALAVAGTRLGEQMALTRDNLIRDILAACASSTNASNGSNGGTPTEITEADIKGVVKTLLGNNARMMLPVQIGSAKVGTTPGSEAFWGIFDSDILDDLEDVNGFVPVAEYPSGKGGDVTEWGQTGNVRWLLTSEGYVSSSTYSLPIIGREAFACTDLTGATAKNIVKPFGSAGTADPLDQRATSGWKMAFVARILNDNFMHLLKVTHS